MQTKGFNLSISRKGRMINCRSCHNCIGQQCLFLFLIPPTVPMWYRLCPIKPITSFQCENYPSRTECTWEGVFSGSEWRKLAALWKKNRNKGANIVTKSKEALTDPLTRVKNLIFLSVIYCWLCWICFPIQSLNLK